MGGEMTEIRSVVPGGAELGEGPLWDPRDKVLYWVNILAGEIHRFDPATGEDAVCVVPEPVGSLAVRARGGLVAAMGRRFCFVDFATAAVTPIAEVEPDKPDNRMNDGKPDRQGRFWAGSMHNPHNRTEGSLYRLDTDLSWKKVVEGVTVSNALAWSPDSRTMYYGDSMAHTVWAWDFEPASGEVSNRRVFLDPAAMGGPPDGATVDEEGCYWVTVPRTWKLKRFDPKGRLDRVVELPVSNPTCAMFGGEKLEVLYVTSATFMANPEDLRDQPQAGALLAIDVGVRGLPEAFFAG
jgi:L-arabinonolactonase